ncbi:TPA: hypothetical protein MYQ04_000098 [Citrobacter braakii]|nr:hypothetical protein [Citrobacter braakii]
MAEIWPNLLPHKTFRADASLRQRLDSGHFLCPSFAVGFDSNRHSLGIELIISVWPKVDNRTKRYREMRENGWPRNRIPVFIREGGQYRNLLKQ